MNEKKFVSIHGGHSGEFCDHAKDSLEDIVQTYIAKGFSWVGITEHTPAISTKLLDPGQIKAGITPEDLYKKFGRYIKKGRQLQEKYKDQIELYVAMEIETYSGYQEFVPKLIQTFKPDYFVGSVHFVEDICFDYSPQMYDKARQAAGGLTELYCAYFDLQFEMIKILKPAVVGHFDLIRIFDPDYKKSLQQTDIKTRIERNLCLIKENDLILDYNLRALLKGAEEPYISEPILQRAKELEIAVVPGDDSHSIDTVGANIETGIEMLQKAGFTSWWNKPTFLIHN